MRVCVVECIDAAPIHARSTLIRVTYQTGINQFDRPLSCPNCHQFSLFFSQHLNSSRRHFFPTFFLQQFQILYIWTATTTTTIHRKKIHLQIEHSRLYFTLNFNLSMYEVIEIIYFWRYRLCVCVWMCMESTRRITVKINKQQI